MRGIRFNLTGGPRHRLVVVYSLIACLAAQRAAGQTAGTNNPRVDVLDSTRGVTGSVPAGQSGKAPSQQDILNAILRSGLTAQEIRLRLSAAGYDPHLADAYLGGGGSGASASLSSPPSAFVDALRNAGILRPLSVGDDAVEPDPAETIDAAPAAGSAPSGSRASSSELRTFGKTLFGRTSTLFDAVTSGPVDASYRIGAGDQLQLVMTGSVEMAYQLEVRRDGS